MFSFAFGIHILPFAPFGVVAPSLRAPPSARPLLSSRPCASLGGRFGRSAGFLSRGLLPPNPCYNSGATAPSLLAVVWLIGSFLSTWECGETPCGRFSTPPGRNEPWCSRRFGLQESPRSARTPEPNTPARCRSSLRCGAPLLRTALAPLGGSRCGVVEKTSATAPAFSTTPPRGYSRWFGSSARSYRLGSVEKLPKVVSPHPQVVTSLGALTGTCSCCRKIL